MLAVVLATTSAGCADVETASTAPTPAALSTSAADGPVGGTALPAATPAPAPVAAFTVSDLVVEGDAAAVRPGDDVVISVRVQNTGDATGTYDAMLTVDGLVSGRQVADLAAGQSAVLRYSIPAAAAGEYDIRVGDAQVTLRVLARAAFSVSALDAVPNPVNSGKTLEVSVKVDNTGGEAGTHTVKVRIDGKVAAAKDVTVSGGEQTEVLFSIKAPAAGRHTVSVGQLKTKLVVWKIARPPNAKVLVNKVGGGYGRLTVKNRGEGDAVVVLAKSSAPTRTLLAMYVRGGKSATVKGIKDGNYIVYVSTGRRWDTASRSFTASQEHRRFDDKMRFKTTRTTTLIKYSVWALTLQAASGGNAPTSSVGEEDFPGIR